MGTGTSHGVPVIGCDCKVCQSKDKKDKRLRCSAYIENLNEPSSINSFTSIVIDVGPEFRIQALNTNIKRLDGVLITHSHADHCHGLDDVRIFSHTRPDQFKNGHKIEAFDSNVCYQNYPLETEGPGIPIYANENTIDDLKFRFAYVFNHKYLGGGLPKLNLLSCKDFNYKNPIEIGSLNIVPISMLHGSLPTSGWLINPKNSANSIAYLTDCSFISDDSIEVLRKFNSNGKVIEHVIIDGLREKPHSTHCSFEEAMSYADKIGAKHTWLTHMSHTKLHTEIQDYIDERLHKFKNLSQIIKNSGSVSPAYDGLELIIE